MLDDGESIDDYSEEYDQFAEYRIQVNRKKTDHVVEDACSRARAE